MATTAKDLIAKLSLLAPDTKVLADVWTPLDVQMSNTGFDILEEHWDEIVDIFEKNTRALYDKTWEEFADAKSDVLINYLCLGCDMYDYSVEDEYCEYCREIDKEDNQ